VYQFLPHGVTFALPVTSVVPYDPSLVPAGQSPTLWKAQPGGTYAQVTPITVDPVGKKITAQVTSFSFVAPAVAPTTATTTTTPTPTPTPSPTAPAVTGIAPATATQNSATSIAVTGTNLPTTAVLSVTNGTCAAPTSQSATGFTSVCTFAVLGNQSVTVLSATGATALTNSSGVNAIVVTAPIISTLNDTGITASQCVASASTYAPLVSCTDPTATALSDTQDGMLGRDVTASDPTDGKLGFSFSTVSGGCVKDNVTGLMWEGKTVSNTTIQYTNADTPASAADVANYIIITNTYQPLCGYTDWRLPTPEELQSIVDYGATSGARIDTTWFPNTQANIYWASTKAAAYSGQVWGVDFNDGSESFYTSGSTHYVRLVRGTSATPSYSYSATGDEVIDNVTGLIWRRCSEGTTWNGTTCTGTGTRFTFAGAFAQAKTQATSTSKPWRVPNIKELASITKKSVAFMAIDSTAFPATSNDYYWTSSPVVGLSGNAWIVNSPTGSVSPYDRTANSAALRLVR